MYALIQRYEDWRRERRIRRIGESMRQMVRLREWTREQLRADLAELTREIEARSPEQVERMERRLGLAR